MTASTVCWRDGAPLPARASSLKRSPSRALICSTPSRRTRAAASSSASGMPSSRRQISATVAALASVSSNSDDATRARSRNRRTDSLWFAVAAVRTPAAGTPNVGTVNSVSPSTPSGSRSVTSSFSSRQPRSSSRRQCRAALGVRLGVVEHHQHAAGLQPRQHAREHGAAGFVAHAEQGCQRFHQALGFGERRHVHEPHAVRERLELRLGEPQREPRLARAADAARA